MRVLQKLNEAYEILPDEDSRKKYDLFLQENNYNNNYNSSNGSNNSNSSSSSTGNSSSNSNLLIFLEVVTASIQLYAMLNELPCPTK